MSGVFGYEDFCGNRAALECSYSSCDGCPVKDAAMPKITALQAENAKLRELCATVIDDWMSKVCPTFPFCEYGGEYQDCTDETCGNQIYRQMARELGVEVES